MAKRTIKKRVHRNTKIVPEGERKCPICGETMYVEKIKGISSDVCEDHGIWLDRGEFTKITRKIKTLMRIQNSEAVRKAKRDGKISGHFLGVWSFLLD